MKTGFPLTTVGVATAAAVGTTVASVAIYAEHLFEDSREKSKMDLVKGLAVTGSVGMLGILLGGFKKPNSVGRGLLYGSGTTAVWISLSLWDKSKSKT